MAGQSCPAWGPAWAAQGMGLSLAWAQENPTHPCMGLGPWPAWEGRESGALGCWLLAALSVFLLSVICLEFQWKNLLLQVAWGSPIPSLVVCGCIGPGLDSGHPHPLPGSGGSHLLLAELPPLSCLVGM